VRFYAPASRGRKSRRRPNGCSGWLNRVKEVSVSAVEVQIGPISGTGEWESNFELRLRYSCTKTFTSGLKAGDYLVIVPMLRQVEDEIEGERTPVRCDPGLPDA
jgi:hypothetical protein